MEKEQKKKIESEKNEICSYDERKKLLTHTTRETKDSEMGTLTMETKGILNKKGIEMTLSGLKGKQKAMEENLEILEKLTRPTPKMTPELELLKTQLEILQKIQHDENVKPEEKVKEAEDLKNTKEALADAKRKIKEITEEIGDRLKL